MKNVQRSYFCKFDQCANFEPDANEQNRKINLLFTITFGEQLKEDVKFLKVFKAKEVKFAIKIGELRMKIINGKVLSGDIKYMKPFAVERKVSVKNEHSGSISTKDQIGVKTKVGMTSPTGEAEGGLHHEKTLTQGVKRTISTDDTMYFIKANMSSTEPRWKFYTDTSIDDQTLWGEIIQYEFAAVTYRLMPVRVQYTFHAEPKDVVYTSIRLSDMTDVTNKQRVLKRSLTKEIFGNSEIICSGEVRVS